MSTSILYFSMLFSSSNLFFCCFNSCTSLTFASPPLAPTSPPSALTCPVSPGVLVASAHLVPLQRWTTYATATLRPRRSAARSPGQARSGRARAARVQTQSCPSPTQAHQQYSARRSLENTATAHSLRTPARAHPSACLKKFRRNSPSPGQGPAPCRSSLPAAGAPPTSSTYELYRSAAGGPSGSQVRVVRRRRPSLACYGAIAAHEQPAAVAVRP